MTQKSMMYDHPAYTNRQQHQPSQKAAGATATFDKFVAFTNMHVFALHATTVAAGTSTYTAWNGTATVTTTGTGDQLSGIKVSGTTTTTYGPYALDNAVGSFRRIQIFQAGVGSATSDGGLALAPGDTFHMVRGTDATAVQIVAMEFGVDPNALVSN